MIVDHEGLITEANPADRRDVRLGAHRRARQAVPRADGVSPEHRDDLAPGCSPTATGPLLGSRLEINALRSDYRTFSAEIAITRVDVPGPLLFAVSLRDVTKRQSREERLREAEAKYRTLVEQIPLATYINSVGLPVQTTYMSPQIEAMFGFPVSDWLEPDFLATRCHPDDRERVLAEVERTHETAEDFRLEYRLIASDGRIVWVLDETVVVRDDGLPADRAPGLPRRHHRTGIEGAAAPLPRCTRPAA